jgi:hypothetical protein
MCEDYRAGASIDLQHDEADLTRKIACPLLALWAANGNVVKSFDVLAVRRERASKCQRQSPAGRPHFARERTQRNPGRIAGVPAGLGFVASVGAVSFQNRGV